MSAAIQPADGSPSPRSGGGAETPRAVVGALLVLTFTTGIVDAVALLGIGPTFVANQTGNVVLLGFALAGASGFSIAVTGISLAAFLGGVTVGGRIGAGRGRAASARGWLALALCIEIALLALAAVLSVGLDLDGVEWRRYLVVAMIAAAMGVRNAAVRDLAVKDLTTTTVVTMTMTGLLSDTEREGGMRGPNLTRRGGAVAAMLAGAVAGALLVIHVNSTVPLAIAAVSAVVSLALVMRIAGPNSP